MSALLPCPFCGGEPEADIWRSYRAINSGEIGRSVAIYCRDCTADLSICCADVPEYSPDDLMADLTARWNRRAAAPAAPPSALLTAARSVQQHWDEFGPEHGFDRVVDQLRKAIAAAPAAPPQPDVLKEIQQKLRVMLGSSIELYGDECVTGYQIKTGALHSIIGIMNGAGYPVSLPLFPVTAAPAAPLPADSNRPGPEWYANKIKETLDDDFEIGPGAPGGDAWLERIAELAVDLEVAAYNAGRNERHLELDRRTTAAFEAIRTHLRDRPAAPLPGELPDEQKTFEAWALGERLAYRDEQHGLCFYDAGGRPHAWRAWIARAALSARGES